MLMLASDPSFCGGMGNVATVVAELAEENPGYAAVAVACAGLFADAAPRRLGWILDEFGGGAPDGLKEYCTGLSSSPSYLSPTASREGALDGVWDVFVNEEVDPDL